MSYKIGSVCAVYRCTNYKQQKDSKSFFRMPKNKDILEKWVEACQRKDLDDLIKIEEPAYFYNTYVVCSDHFDIRCFRNRNLFSQGLLPGSVPTLFLDNSTDKSKRKNENEILLTDLFSPEKKSTTMNKIMENLRNNTLTEESTSDLVEISTSELAEPSTNYLIESLRQEISVLKSQVKQYKETLNSRDCLLREYINENEILKRQLNDEKIKFQI